MISFDLQSQHKRREEETKRKEGDYSTFMSEYPPRRSCQQRPLVGLGLGL